MCRLLGLVANKPVDIEFSLQRFKKFAKNNPDGWGIGWYENNSPMSFQTKYISNGQRVSTSHFIQGS